MTEILYETPGWVNTQRKIKQYRNKLLCSVLMLGQQSTNNAWCIVLTLRDPMLLTLGYKTA